MSVVITSLANRFSMNGVIFMDFINLDEVLLISLCKDRYYERFDMLFFFSLGTRNSSYTDETLLRVGPFPNSMIQKAEDFIGRMVTEKNKVFKIDDELLSAEDDVSKGVKSEEETFASKAKAVAIETAKRMKSEGISMDIICKVLGLSEAEFS
jgi:hypothetical protein